MRVSIGRKSDVFLARLTSRFQQGWVPFLRVLLLQVVGGIQFLAVKALRPPFSYWLWAVGCSQQLKIAHIACHVSSPILKTNLGESSLTLNTFLQKEPGPF